MSLVPRARIHLDNIVANWRAIGSLHPGIETGAVVKADAYGHGVGPVAAALNKAGCKTFFVAYVDEGTELRAILGPGPDILVFNGVEADDLEAVRTSALIPVLNALPDLGAWLSLATSLPYAVHIDTGMNRLGVRAQDITRLRSLTAASAPVHVMSHLADSDWPANPLNTRQRKTFEDLAAHYPGARKSFSNTGGCYLGGSYGFDMLRPGIGLYGGGPPAPAGTVLKAGMTLEAPILTIQHVDAGETTGYGATHRFETPSTLATVALGYGDGFPRSASNKGVASLGGVACPIVGRVSMDLITIDVSGAQRLAKPGAFAQFIGPEVPLEDQAKRAGTVGYELVTGLGHRVRRIFD